MSLSYSRDAPISEKAEEIRKFRLELARELDDSGDGRYDADGMVPSEKEIAESLRDSRNRELWAYSHCDGLSQWELAEHFDPNITQSSVSRIIRQFERKVQTEGIYDIEEAHLGEATGIYRDEHKETMERLLAIHWVIEQTALRLSDPNDSPHELAPDWDYIEEWVNSFKWEAP